MKLLTAVLAVACAVLAALVVALVHTTPHATHTFDVVAVAAPPRACPIPGT